MDFGRVVIHYLINKMSPCKKVAVNHSEQRPTWCVIKADMRSGDTKDKMPWPCITFVHSCHKTTDHTWVCVISVKPQKWGRIREAEKNSQFKHCHSLNHSHTRNVSALHGNTTRWLFLYARAKILMSIWQELCFFSFTCLVCSIHQTDRRTHTHAHTNKHVKRPLL